MYFNIKLESGDARQQRGVRSSPAELEPEPQTLLPLVLGLFGQTICPPPHLQSSPTSDRGRKTEEDPSKEKKPTRITGLLCWWDLQCAFNVHIQDSANTVPEDSARRGLSNGETLGTEGNEGSRGGRGTGTREMSQEPEPGLIPWQNPVRMGGGRLFELLVDGGPPQPALVKGARFVCEA